MGKKEKLIERLKSNPKDFSFDVLHKPHPRNELLGSFNVRVSPELHKTLALVSASRGQTLNSAVEEAIKHYVNNSAKKTNARSAG